jgi:hypothetical protein
VARFGKECADAVTNVGGGPVGCRGKMKFPKTPYRWMFAAP